MNLLESKKTSKASEKWLKNFSKNFSKIDWDVQEAPCNNHNFPFFNEGIIDMKKDYGFGVKWQIYGNIKGHGFFYTDVKDLVRVGEKLLEYFKKPSRRKEVIHDLEKLQVKMDDFFSKCNFKVIRSLNKKDLEILYRDLLEIFFIYYRKAMFFEPLDSVMDKDFQKFYASLHKNQRKNFINLTLPHKIGFVQKEQLSLLKIARTLKRKKINSFLLKDNINYFIKKVKNIDISLYKLLKGHRNNYVWLRGGYLNTPKLSYLDIVERLKDAIKKGQINKEIRRLENYKRTTDQTKKKIRKTVKASSRIKYFCKLIDEFSYLHDERKEYVLKWCYFCHEVLKEIAKRFKISFNDLQFSLFQEVLDLFKGKKIDQTRLKNRFSSFLFFKTNSKRLTLFGKGAKIFWKNKLSKKENKKTIIHGICGALGKVQGRASIIINVKDFSKFKQGEVLVTTMTRPEFAPLMKKAVAVVTDQGGITCHAAIITRELGIPCIVGTKDASMVLKDGDLVEVNANHGVIKVIKRK